MSHELCVIITTAGEICPGNSCFIPKARMKRQESLRKRPIGYQTNPLLPAHSYNWQGDCREGPRSRNEAEWEPTELKTSALPAEPEEPFLML